MHGRLYTVSFETASRDTQTLNLSRNVSRFYAWQVVRLLNEKQSQNVLLRVYIDPLSSIRNKLITEVENPSLNRRYTRYGFVFRCFLTQSNSSFFVMHQQFLKQPRGICRLTLSVLGLGISVPRGDPRTFDTLILERRIGSSFIGKYVKSAFFYQTHSKLQSGLLYP